MDNDNRVNAQLNASILVEITFLISPYEIFLNDSNGHGFHFFNCYYSNIWIIHVQSLTNLPKFMWKLVFNVIDVIFQFESSKRKPAKFLKIMPHLKDSKTYVFGKKKSKDKKKLQLIWTYEYMVKF